MTLRREDLPLHVTFEDRRYMITATRNGGLIMTGTGTTSPGDRQHDGGE